MKYIITENQFTFARRHNLIKGIIDYGIKFIDEGGDICNWTLGEFVEQLCWVVSDHHNDLNIDMDKVSISKIHEWVGENFYDYMKQEFKRLGGKHNCY